MGSGIESEQTHDLGFNDALVLRTGVPLGDRCWFVKLIVHDFAGHPGQLQLSRELARRGHIVEHQFCQSVTTGKGATSRRSNDPDTFSVRAIILNREFARYSPLRRIIQELRYGWMSARAVLAAKPDVAVFSNVPVLPLLIIVLRLYIRKVPYVFWWQDVYSEAVGSAAQKRLGDVGTVVKWAVARVERTIAKQAAAIVPITEAFVDLLLEWGIDRRKVFVIPNWGALDEVPIKPRVNAWAKSHGLDNDFVVMYAGTLGLKHDPSVIAELARTLPDNCRVVVVSQGKGREWLEENCRDVSKLVLMDFQDYETLPDMLASADVFLALLEVDASRYSVPSKILNYLCAGRPVLALLPSDNAAARVIEHAGAGAIHDPGDIAGAALSIRRLVEDTGRRLEIGRNGRRYAETVFDLVKIGDDFESVILRAAGQPRIDRANAS